MFDVALACLHCMAPPTLTDETCQCRGCRREFPVLLGIPDLRIRTATWIDYEHDRLLATRLAEAFVTESSRSLIEEYWRARGETDPDCLRRRVHYLSHSVSKYHDPLSKTCGIGAMMNKPGQLRCLELGCGPGEFPLAAAEHFDLVVGIDSVVPALKA
jgi:hypothetical protein